MVKHALKKVAEKREKAKKKKQAKTEKEAWVKQIALVLDTELVAGLKGKNLKDQLDAFELAGAPFPKKKDMRKVDKQRQAICNAIDKLNNQEWTLKPDPSDVL